MYMDSQDLINSNTPDNQLDFFNFNLLFLNSKLKQQHFVCVNVYL